MQDLSDFLTPVIVHELNDDQGYTDGQLAKHISIFEDELPDLEGIDIVMVGVAETRGNGLTENSNDAADAIRKHLYQLHFWHTDVTIADIGNVKTGAALKDSYAAIKTVLSELLQQNKTVIILGGSHDITLAQYNAYTALKQSIEVTCIDAMINLRAESPVRSENFLLEMLTGEPTLRSERSGRRRHRDATPHVRALGPSRRP